MKPYIRITRNPYEEPHHVNLVVAASNGHVSSELEIYAHASDLGDAAEALVGFPRHDSEPFLWELGSERPEDRFGFYFRFRVWQISAYGPYNGRCAIHLRFNNNEDLPDRETSEFCIEAYPADIDRLGKLFRTFNKLEHRVLEWSLEDGEVRESA
jgi:hypothetical protein